MLGADKLRRNCGWEDSAWRSARFKDVYRQKADGTLSCPCSFFSRDTYLFFAVLHGQTEVARYLLEEGADMDLLPNEDDGRPCQESLIEIAAMLGNVDILNLLIQAKKFKDRAQAEAEKEAKTETEQQAGQQG